MQDIPCTHCPECGRKLIFVPKTKRWCGDFDTKTGEAYTYINGNRYYDSQFAGRLICPSRWCRYVTQALLFCHFDFYLLTDGQVIAHYHGD